MCTQKYFLTLNHKPTKSFKELRTIWCFLNSVIFVFFVLHFTIIYNNYLFYHGNVNDIFFHSVHSKLCAYFFIMKSTRVQMRWRRNCTCLNVACAQQLSFGTPKKYEQKCIFCNNIVQRDNIRWVIGFCWHFISFFYFFFFISNSILLLLRDLSNAFTMSKIDIVILVY